MTEPRTIRAIAAEASHHWSRTPKGIYFGAVPYLEAMHYLANMRSSYGHDDARTIVLYFLSNATSWRGDVARRIKAELREMLKR